MPNISRRTAVKYVQKAIEQGFLAETPCEADRRIRLITLTPMALEKIEVFLDYSSRCFLAVPSN
jgi:DNA-binding MarR family transcriptional regulator